MNTAFLTSHYALATGSGKTMSGMLVLIRCIPDPFTGEVLNIGVGATDDQGRRISKVITEPARLKCLYGEDSRNVLMLAQMAKQAFLAGLSSPSSQLIFEAPAPFFNSTLEEAVDSVFKDQVTVGFPIREPKSKSSMTDDELWLGVSNQVKESLGLEAHILADNPYVIVQTDRGPRSIYAPIQTPKGVGVVRSAFYDQTTIKLHLMDSVLDLECAARYRTKEKLGLFILRPSVGSEHRLAGIDKVIDGVAARCPRELRLEVRTKVDELAQDIIEWAAA